MCRDGAEVSLTAQCWFRDTSAPSLAHLNPDTHLVVLTSTTKCVSVFRIERYSLDPNFLRWWQISTDCRSRSRSSAGLELSTTGRSTATIPDSNNISNALSTRVPAKAKIFGGRVFNPEPLRVPVDSRWLFCLLIDVSKTSKSQVRCLWAHCSYRVLIKPRL